MVLVVVLMVVGGAVDGGGDCDGGSGSVGGGGVGDGGGEFLRLALELKLQSWLRLE